MVSSRRGLVGRDGTESQEVMGAACEVKNSEEKETVNPVAEAIRKLPEHKTENVELVKPWEVKAHPKNQQIYADDPDPEMVEDIRQNGIREPIVCESSTRYVISGRRRHKAALSIGMQLVPVIWREYRNEEAVVEAIVMHNAYRRKTERQIMLEVEALWDQEAKKNHQRQVEGARKGGRKAKYVKSDEEVTNPQDEENDVTDEHEGVAKKTTRKLTREEVGKVIGQSSIKVARAASIIKRAKEELGDNWQQHPSVQAVFKGEASINSAALNLTKKNRESYFSEIAKRIDKIDADIRLQDNVDNIENESVDHIITDPTFGKKTGYGERIKELGATDVFEGWNSDLILDDLSGWCHEWARVIKTGGNIAIFCEERYVSLMMEALIANGFSMVQDVVWHITNPDSNTKRTAFLDSCQHIVTACMSEEKRSAFRFIGVDQMHNFIEGSDTKGKGALKHMGERPDYVLKWVIERLTNPGDVVLDNFAGTGTTGIACKELKRNFILVEKDEKAFDIIKARLSGLK